MSVSKIEWTAREDENGVIEPGQTWNPVTGCDKISPGCKNCYAERMSMRLKAMGQKKYRNGFDVTFHEDALDIPLRRKKPTRYFVNSMSDLFHEDLSDEQIDQVFAVMALCRQHVFMVLTKRAERMANWMARGLSKGEAIQQAFELNRDLLGGPRDARLFNEPDWPLPNVWLGISAEDQLTLDARVPYLLQCRAAARFLSLEPLLNRVSFSWAKWHDYRSPQASGKTVGYLDGMGGLQWVITGGESGPGARPSDPAWFRQIRDECQAMGVPFFLKQITDHGRKIPFDSWVEGLRVREYPDAL